jgi:two-component sensor histidine kinase
VDVRLYQWADAQSRFNDGEGHALTFLNINEKRRQLYEFTQSTFTFEFALFAKSRDLGQLNILDLSNKRIAVKRGGLPQSVIENSHPEANMVFVDSTDEAFGLLSQGDVDAAVEEKLVGHHFLMQNDIHGIEALEEPLATRSAHVPVIRGNTALLEELNQAISKLKSTGEIRKITRRWLGGPVLFITRDERDAGLIGAALTLALVGILAALLLFNVVRRSRERAMVEGQMRASLAEKEVLLREIHHRVKNNLQVVSSMLSLQAGTETGDGSMDALEEAQRRVKVMARIHESLHKSDDLASINARDHLNTVLEDTIASSGHDARGISYRLDADDIVFDVDHAVACGQIVSELLSNSLKHAFPNGQSGNIEVSLHRRDGGRIELSVADDGKGLPENFDLGRVETLGIRLVHALTMQLSGVVNIDGSAGTCVQVTFPEHRS